MEEGIKNGNVNKYNLICYLKLSLAATVRNIV